MLKMQARNNNEPRPKEETEKGSRWDIQITSHKPFIYADPHQAAITALNVELTVTAGHPVRNVSRRASSVMD